MKHTVIIGYSQQKTNLCLAGDTEHDHTKTIAKYLYGGLLEDDYVECILIDDSPGLLDSERLTNSILKINDEYKRLIENGLTDKDHCVCIMIHTNATEKAEDTAKGVEAIFYPGNNKTKNLGIRICKCLESLGFEDRGTYENSKLKALNSTHMSAIIVECGFHNNREEALKIHLNLQNIALQIINGIYKALDIKTLSSNEKWIKETKNELKKIATGLKDYSSRLETLFK